MSLIAFLLLAVMVAIAWPAIGRAEDPVVRTGARFGLFLLVGGILLTTVVSLGTVVSLWLGTAVLIALAVALAGVRRPGTF
jgi:hypothetical protein